MVEGARSRRRGIGFRDDFRNKPDKGERRKPKKRKRGRDEEKKPVNEWDLKLRIRFGVGLETVG